MATELRAMPDHRSAHDHGPYSAYCQVCWYPVYTLWIDKESHRGACMLGHSQASDCPEAKARAESSRNVLRIKQIIAAAATTPGATT